MILALLHISFKIPDTILMKFTLISGNLKSVSVLLSLIYVSNTAFAARVDSLFQSDEIIRMELRTDFSAIQIDRVDNPQYHDGELIYYSSEGEPESLYVRVRARGNFRRKPENCNIPPLFINFRRTDVNNTLFENQERLKLVTPCQNEEDVIEEYLIYKMYNQVTDLSFKVKLVKILYFDTGSDTIVFEKYSFFLESNDRMAERNDAYEKDDAFVPVRLNKINFKQMAVFQYIIGNKDWYLQPLHNVVILQPADTTLSPLVVPYDFDFSEFVNAEYTKVKGLASELPDSRRRYKGLCYTIGEFNEVFEFYRELKPAFKSVIKSMKLIRGSVRRQNLKYIRSFYKIIDSSELLQQEFLDKCWTYSDYGFSDETP